MRSNSVISSSFVALALMASPETAFAEEMRLSFKLVVSPMEMNTIEPANLEGMMVGLGKYTGVAYFDDGRIASKDFLFNFDYEKGAGPFFGYSTYTFDDGSMITARFDGVNDPSKPLHGDYTVLAGTGVFEGASGSGTFDAVDNPWEGANLLDGEFVLTMP